VAVDGLDLDVAVGETLALLGPNGAGKTTTVECCEGYRRPDAGRSASSASTRAATAAALNPRVGLMLQEGGVYPHGLPRTRCCACSPVSTPTRSTPSSCSSGSAWTTPAPDPLPGPVRWAEAAAVAGAGAGRPPRGRLPRRADRRAGPRRAPATWEHVAELQADRVTVVLTTHLLDEAEELADRVAIVDRGRLVAQGTPRRAHPRRPPRR
jgi:ABC-2 type transport system ATP-binding protein